MNRRLLFALVAVTSCLLIGGIAIGAGGSGSSGSFDALRAPSGLPDGFEPAVLRAQDNLNRYFVVVDGPYVASEARGGRSLSSSQQRNAAAAARASQEGAVSAARSLGGDVIYRYDTLLNGFSANLSPDAVSKLAARADVRSVQPVSVVEKLNESSVPFIGGTRVWQDFGARGQGMTVAVVDTGIDYTHANFGGPGTVAAYEANDPNFIEPGTFPTRKVIGGYDFVGSNYSVTDEDPTNDVPRPDADPLDGVDDDHGSHTAGSCCGNGVPGEIGRGVAPAAKLLAIKVWDEGDSTEDVLVAGYERAMDPNDDGDIDDAADVLSFSGGVDYGTLNSVEARAAQRVVDLGTVFVASAGNSGNQPVGGSAYIVGTPATARGVLSVAASIDEFNAQTIDINSPAHRPARRRAHGPAGLGRRPPARRADRRPLRRSRARSARGSGQRDPRRRAVLQPAAGRLAERRDGARVQGRHGRGRLRWLGEGVPRPERGRHRGDPDLALRRRPERARLGRREHHDPGGDDHRQRRLRDPRRAQPLTARVQHRDGQRDAQRRDRR